MIRNQATRDAHVAVMRRVKAALGAVESAIPPGSRIALLDTPVHVNIGDLLIHLGTERWLAERNVEVVLERCVTRFYRIAADRWDAMTPIEGAFAELAALPKDVVLAFHGGGNTGDLYDQHQRFREDAIARFPDRRIVVLPQSAHFKDPRRLEQFRACADQHPDLHFYARDLETQAMLLGLQVHVATSPDMAHALWGSRFAESGEPAGSGELRQTRRDVESAAGGATAFDWDQIATPTDRLFTLARIPQGNRLPFLPDGLRNAIWHGYRNRIVRQAEAMFGRHERIVTDRLHGTILGLLMSREVEATDNSYGKLSRYASLWMPDSPVLRFRDAEAVRLGSAA